jgi:hypothetical protein
MLHWCHALRTYQTFVNVPVVLLFVRLVTLAKAANTRDVAFVDSPISLATALSDGVRHVVVTADLDMRDAIKAADQQTPAQGLVVSQGTKSIRVRAWLGVQ